MNREVNVIASRLSLRQPQRESLEILADIVTQIPLGEQKNLAETLQIINSTYPSVTDFERDFPSLCFALATGVGKTRLMGAFIAYLHSIGVSRHFFVLAPNLTIYEKLIFDFTQASPKYVFKGISQFAQNSPVIITGENYDDGRGVRFDRHGQGRLFENENTAYINIFNISKINSEVRGGKSPRIKRLQEYIGESYFDYLSSLDDLVLLMDEAHRYRASAGAKAINDLKPILGIELTATPKNIGSNPVEFKNVVYSYPLASALRDGFVKEPAVATRKDFRPENYSKEQLERIKLEDGIHYHEHIKVELEVYSRQQEVQNVKPFILIVAQDTTHAKEIRQIIESDDFFEGRYKGRVIEVHTKLSGAESDEAMQRLLAVETDEYTEIVIHVNKLKEGWDVTNLYTIVPLRTSASEILTEQTIGRGLRLPYGKRTGIDTVDRLTIIAHDKFQEIIDQANSPESIIKKQITIGAGGDISPVRPQTVSVPSMVETILTGITPSLEKTIDNSFSYPSSGATNQKTIFQSPQERNIASVTLEVVRKYEHLESSDILKSPEIQEKIISKVRELTRPQQMVLPGIEKEPDFKKIVEIVTQKIVELTIDIPNIVLIPTHEVTFGFYDFNLERLRNIRPQPVNQEILIQHLRTNEKDYLFRNSTQTREARPEDYLIRSLIEHDEIDYDDNAELLYKLSAQLVEHLKSYLFDEKDVENVLLYHQKTLSELIFNQMMEHYWETPTDYIVKVSKGFTVLKPNSFSLPSNSSPKYFLDTLTNPSAIRQMVFGGFEKCCYPYQKFDSDTERRFAVVLEDDKSVLRWMKPGSGHFQIEYRNGIRYEPDFIVETETQKLICEPKASNEIQSEEVQAKARAAIRWCEHATKHAQNNVGKSWIYLLIPHDAITFNRTVDGLIEEFKMAEVTR